MSIDGSTRHQLVILARRSHARVTAFSRNRPTEWRPGEVRDPAGTLATHFTDAAAWELIASRLESGHDVETVELRKPPGAKGYVMKIDLEPDDVPVYVKLQLGPGRIIGRSFPLLRPGVRIQYMETRHSTAPLRAVARSGYTCPQCGGCGVTTSRCHHTFRYGSGRSAVDLAVDVPVCRCDSCEFEFLDDEAERLKHEAICEHLGVLSSTKIRRIRKSYGMTRAVFAQVTGLGEATLNRWENGILIQTLANDRYIRLLARPRDHAGAQEPGVSRANLVIPIKCW